MKVIISNHRDFYQLAASYNIPFHHIPVTAATKQDAEAKQLEIIRAEGAELVVLARAVKWHGEHRVLLNGHKTVVFR